MKIRRRVAASVHPKYLAEPGYSASGESKFSRAAANGNLTRRMAGSIAPRRIAKGRELNLSKKSRETQAGVAWIEAQLRIEDSPSHKAKLRKNLEIKSRYLVELRRQQ